MSIGDPARKVGGKPAQTQDRVAQEKEQAKSRLKSLHFSLFDGIHMLGRCSQLMVFRFSLTEGRNESRSQNHGDKRHPNQKIAHKEKLQGTAIGLRTVRSGFLRVTERNSISITPQPALGSPTEKD